MTNDFRMSYFMPPIAPIKNEQGRIVTPATLIPSCEVSRRTSFSNDNLQRESQNSEPSKYAIPGRYTDSKSITIALCDFPVVRSRVATANVS